LVQFLGGEGREGKQNFSKIQFLLSPKLEEFWREREEKGGEMYYYNFNYIDIIVLIIILKY
jgi:hypothetical protein